jgi:hypothetical protein
MIRVTKVSVLPRWRLAVVFSDGVEGEVSLEDRLFGPVFEPLRDVALFSQAYIDEFGAICWPNGADLAPDALHERLTTQNSAA